MDEIIPRAPLAYENKKFLNSPDARILRILSEYSEPLARFRRERIQDTVVFFGSARFHSRHDAQRTLELLEKPGSRALASPEEQEKILRARAAVEMAGYYEDARSLAHKLTDWAMRIPSKRRRFVVTTGGGPGIMEAANQGASEAGGKTIGLNINLPYEQMPNRYISPELNLEFHYFFMRKLWFAYLAKALIVFPGGFGTCDELFEILTLAQTEKLAKKILVVMYGSKYWDRVLNLDAMAESGTISPEDKNQFKMVDSVDEAFDYLKDGLTKYHLGPPQKIDKAPEIAKTRP
ncbi:MAG: TIGR00730 family Rossman fold protein [Terriglobales bacterium]